MKAKHWIGVLVLLVIGYAIGVKWPTIGQQLKSKVAGAAA